MVADRYVDGYTGVAVVAGAAFVRSDRGAVVLVPPLYHVTFTENVQEATPQLAPAKLAEPDHPWR